MDNIFSSAVGINQDQLHQRIAKADYHGCLLMVTRSKNPSYIGARGIVVLETKNTFQIICEDDKLKSINSISLYFVRKIPYIVYLQPKLSRKEIQFSPSTLANGL